MKQKITFFYTDNCERQAVSPIAAVAELRGYEVEFSTDLTQRAMVGVYCSHQCNPNADVSVIMLHDLAQRHDIWPEFWLHEPWHQFDIGFLPGQAWVQRWENQNWRAHANPRFGMFDIGWPKADLIYKNKTDFELKTKLLRDNLNLKFEHSILYAPSWENDAKQDDFVRALLGLPVNLILKQAPWASSYSWVHENIKEMNRLHSGIADNVYIVDPEVSIMYCIGLSDVLVSDESSVLIEAALYGIPSIAITDWLIPDREPPRPACVPFENIHKITKKELRSTIQSILADPAVAKVSALQLKDYHFSNFSKSSELAMDIIEAKLLGNKSHDFALKISPISRLNHDIALYEKAEGLFDSGNKVHALKLLNLLANTNTEYWKVYSDLAVINFIDGNESASKELIEHAVSISERDPAALKNYASILMALSRYDEALELYYECLKINSIDLEAFDLIRQNFERRSSISNHQWSNFVELASRLNCIGT